MKKFPQFKTYDEIKDKYEINAYLLKLTNLVEEEIPTKEANWFDNETPTIPRMNLNLILVDENFNWNDYMYFDYNEGTKTFKIIKKDYFNKLKKDKVFCRFFRGFSNE